MKPKTEINDQNQNMKKWISLLLFLLIFSSCSRKSYVINVSFKDSPTPAAPDYSKPENWASLPDKKDAADSVPLKSGLQDLQSNAEADVFFLYPTTFTQEPANQYQWNADVNDATLNSKTQLSTILNQASIFNGACRVYAPYYRQAHYYAFLTSNKEDRDQSLELAYTDVKAAFEYYLSNFNKGRPIVIASHSQGSHHAERLIKEFFNGKELQKKLVVAYLVGRAISPDAFSQIHPTEKPDETGVWASWNTFARNFIPATYETYFKGSLSTNPHLWNSREEFAGKELNAGGVGLHFTFVPHAVDAQNHESLLWINKPYIKGRALLRTKTWHRADMNLFYMNIRENVALRIKKYQEMATQ
jgi:hypothetical protein